MIIRNIWLISGVGLFSSIIFFASSSVLGMATSNLSKQNNTKKIEIKYRSSNEFRNVQQEENGNKNEVISLVPPPSEIPIIVNKSVNNVTKNMLNTPEKTSEVKVEKVKSHSISNIKQEFCNTNLINVNKNIVSMTSSAVKPEANKAQNITKVYNNNNLTKGTKNNQNEYSNLINSEKSKNTKDSVSQIAGIQKLKSLFTFKRLLNFDQRPQEEELLKDNPIIRNGKKIWFKIRYIENWRNITDMDAYLEKIAFQITVMDGNKPIQVVKTPVYAVSPKSVSKGKVISVIEILPYRLIISLDQFNATKDGVTDIIYKLDIIG